MKPSIQCHDEPHKACVVKLTHASAQPRTMVVKSLHTVATVGTVCCALWSKDEASLTELKSGESGIRELWTVCTLALQVNVLHSLVFECYARVFWRQFDASFDS